MSPKLFPLLGAQPTASEYRIIAPYPQSFHLCRFGAGMSSDFFQEAAPGSVHQVLLVGKMPKEVPSGLQVLSCVGQRWRWGASPPGLGHNTCFPAARAVVLSSEPADTHLHFMLTRFTGRRPALLPSGLARLPYGQCTGWGIGWVYRPAEEPLLGWLEQHRAGCSVMFAPTHSV